MSDKTDKMLEGATVAARNQSMSAKSLEKAAATRAAEVEKHDTAEAAQLCEDTVAWLKDTVQDRGLTPEQMFFAIALVTINIRNHFPTDKGGKELFDATAKRAWEYFERNK